MPYIGRELERGTYLKLDDISSSFDGNKTIFNLTKGGDPFFPGSPQSIIVSVNGTILEPVTEYGIDSSKIVFATAPANGHAFFSITLGLPFGVFDNGSIEDGSLTGFKLSNPFNYDGGLLFLNSLTDKVGIRTENPIHDLDVHGDVRIVGILTVGTSSLILDGSNNKIQVGTALTLSHNDGAQIGKSHLHSTGYDLKDDAKIKLGDDGDLEIFHQGSNNDSIIRETGSGSLSIQTNGSFINLYNTTDTVAMATFTTGGSCAFRHGATTRLETTTTGATVTGKLVVTGDLDVQGTTTTLDTTLTEVDKLEVGANNVTVGVAITQSGTGDALTIDDGTSRVLTVKDGGNVGIGTDNPLSLLSLGASANPTLEFKDYTNNARSQILASAGGQLVFQTDIGNVNANSDFIFRADSILNEIVRFKDTGEVGIGSDNPKMQLHAYNSTPSDTGGILVSNVSYSANQDKPYLIIGTKDWTGAATNWNTFGFQHKIKVDSAGVPRLTIDGASGGSEIEHFTFKNGGFLGIGITNPSGKLHLPDGGQLRLGNDSDLKIFHNGSLGVIGNVTGDLFVQSNQDADVGGDIYIRAKAGENSIYCQSDGTVSLYNDNVPRFRTYNEGVQVLGAEGGNAAILIKADEGDDNNDIYRIIAGNGTNLFFQSYATGSYVTNLKLTGDGNGAVELNHAGTKRLETTNTGVSITDNLKVAGISTFTGNGTFDDIEIGAWSADSNYAGVFHKNQTGNEYMILSKDDHTFVSASTGHDVVIRGGNNTNTNNIRVTPDSDGIQISGNTTFNNNIDVDGQTDLDVLNVAELATFAGITTVTGETLFTKQLSVAGVTTFSDDINVDSGKILVLNSNGSNPVIKIQGNGPNVIRFASDSDGTVDADSIDLAYRTTPNTITFRRSSDAAEFLTVDADDGLVTVSNNLNVTGDLDVDGQTDLDDLAVAGVSTFSADVNVGDGSAQTRILIKKADEANDAADHIQFYNGTTRTGEIGSLDNSWLRINQTTNKNIYTPRYIRADNGFFVDDTTKGINGSGNFIGGTIAGASDYNTLLRSDTSDTMNGILTVGGSSVGANEGGEIRVTLAPNSNLVNHITIDQYIDKLRIFEGSGGTARGATIDFTRITGNTDNEIFSSGLTGVGFTVTHLRSFGIPNGVVAISTSTQAHIPLTVTNSGGHSSSTIIAKFVGDSDGLEIRNTAAGDYNIRNSQQNNGIAIFDGTGGVDINYNNSRKLTVKSGGTSLNDELTFENDDEGVTTFGGGRFYKKNGGGIAIRQSTGNQTPIIENNAGTLQGTILHTGNASTELTQFLRSDANDTFTGTLTAGQDGKIAFPDNTTIPDNPTSQQHDYITFGAHGSISQVSGRGALMITSSDDSLILANGDVGRAFTNSHINVDPEDVFVLSDGQFIVKTDLQEGFGTEHTLTFSNTGVLTIGSDTVLTTGNIGANPVDQIVLGNDSSGSTPRRLVFASADTGTVTIQADTSSGATYTPSNGRIGAQQIDVDDIIGNTTIDGNLIFAQGHVAQHHNTGTRDKYRVWSNSTYAIGMDDAMTYGSLSNYAMTFQVDNTNSMGWVFLDDAHSDAQGAMSLTTQGKMNIAHSLRIGYGESDTTNAGTNGRLDVSGQIQATSQIIAGRGGGGIALTINDGHGNANVCFNHNGGTPEQNGASGRIQVNTDNANADSAFMKFELKSAVTGGTGVTCTEVLNLMSDSTAAPFRMGFLTSSPEATFHIESNHNASDVPTMKLSEFRPSIHFEDVSTSATDWQILCDHNDISNSLQFRSGDSSSENKLSHLEYYMDYTGFHIGNSDGNRQRKLYLHAGTAANDMAELFCSNGNLHIDAENGHHTYINHYQGNEVRLNYGGNQNSGLRLCTKSDGVEITGLLDINNSGSNRILDIHHTDGDSAYVAFLDQNTTDNAAVRVGAEGDDFKIFAGSSERFRIDSNGNIGINATPRTDGTIFTTVDHFLCIGDSDTGIAQDGDGQFEIWANNQEIANFNTNAVKLTKELRVKDGSQGSPGICFNSDQDTGIYRKGSNNFCISTGGNTTFMIDSDKRVMLGDDAAGATTSNDRNATLYVRQQNSQKALALRSTSSGTDMIDIWSNKLDDGDGTDDDTVHLLAFRVGSGTSLKGSIVYQEGTGQTLYSAGSSDRRLKENIVGIDNAIDVIKQLKPCNFNFNKLFYNNNDIKHSRAKTISGFIADEVENLIPQAVMGDKDAVYTEDDSDTGAKKGDIIPQQMDMTKMIPHLTKALQEAVTKIETLEAEVATLKAKVG